MKILRLIRASFEQFIDHWGVLNLNNLFLLYSIFISFGLAAGFFLIGSFFAYIFFGVHSQYYLPIIYIAIFLGAISFSLAFFPTFGTYLNYCYELTKLKRSYNLMEYLEHLDRNLLKYFFSGWMMYGPSILYFFIIFLVYFLVQKNPIILSIMFLIGMVLTFFWFSFSWLTNAAIIISKKTPIEAFFESVLINKKNFFESILVLGFLFFLKMIGILFLVLFPFYVIFIFYPIYSYIQIYYYKGAKNLP
jgi:hypothetical protein